MDMNLSKLWDIVEDREAWHAGVHGVTKSRTRLSDWTTTATFVLQNPSSHDTYLLELTSHRKPFRTHFFRLILEFVNESN